MNQTTTFDEHFLVLIVTGLSGAGKTSAMRTLEDAGFYCVDNLPIPLIEKLFNFLLQSNIHPLKLAIGIDARSKTYFQNFMVDIETLKQKEEFKNLKVLFLKASEETLIKRFQETRRNHPLLNEKRHLLEAIRQEILLLEPIMKQADIVLDTDIFTIHELRNWVRQSFEHKTQRAMLVSLVSFGFKYGLPLESNLIFDVRFLPNPYFVEELKSLSGKDALVQTYVFSKDETIRYADLLFEFINTTLGKYYQEGRYFVTVAIGCTGGKHRSVSLIEKLAKTTIANTTMLVHHRDITKE